MKRYLLVISFLIISTLVVLIPKTVLASCPSSFSGDCSSCGGNNSPQCIPMTSQNVQILNCGCTSSAPPPPANNPFGTVNNPLPYGNVGAGSGLIILFNNILRLVFAAAGVFAFIKIMQSGFAFLNAGGDPKKIEQAWAGIWQSLLGLAIIISAFAVAALAGQILFGNAGAILNPNIYGPGLVP